MTEWWFLVLVWFNSAGDVTWHETHEFRSHQECVARLVDRGRFGPGLNPRGVCSKVERAASIND